MKDQSKKEKILLTIAFVLMIIGIVNAIRVLFVNRISFVNVGTAIIYLLITIYAVVLYKVPHGNLLKLLILFFAFVLSFFAISSYTTDTLSAFLTSAAVILMTFMSGRLDRYKQNVVLASVVLVALLVAGGKDYILMNSQKDMPKETMVIEGDIENMPDVDMEMINEEPEAANPTIFNRVCGFLSFFNMPIMWATVFLGYCARYSKHKEAGLLDK